MSIGIIIQARIGSTRLPNKMVLPFYKEKGILETIIIRLLEANLEVPIIIATSDKEKDNSIEHIALKYQLKIFRGSEQNVLDRYIKAAEKFNIDKIIRICADNPFLDIFDLSQQIKTFKQMNVDYLYYCDKNKTPTIKTNFGFWAEGVSLKALNRINTLTSDKFYQEHVTNYIYTHPDFFKLDYKYIDPLIDSENRIRLTVDTEKDFRLSKEIFLELRKRKESHSINEIIEIVKSNEEWLEIMKNEIANNIK